MDLTELNTLADEIEPSMQFLVRHVATPLVVVREGETIPIGTGTFFRWCGHEYVLTAEHVVGQGDGGTIQHLSAADSRFLASGSFGGDPFPVDVAIARVGAKFSLPSKFLDTSFKPVDDREILFFLGYPASSARRMESVTPRNIRRGYFDTFPVEPLSFCGQLVHDGKRGRFDPEMHVAFKYPLVARTETGAVRDLLNPEGLSGTLLWDTKRVSAWRRGVEWDPSMARVCGVIHTDNDGAELIYATKIEHVRPSILRLLRQERAYLHWIDRGQPFGDELTDWVQAEKEVPDLAGC
jgi:hypothetical protein